MTFSRSPDRYTFQRDAHISACKEDGSEPNSEYLKLFEKSQQLDKEFEAATSLHENNLEYDLRSTEWILEKARVSDTYAQNLYAALCNNSFQKIDVMVILKDQSWSCSWRHAGGIVADMQQKGDYMEWYCSGIGAGLGNGDEDGTKGYVAESVITDEITEDLARLGWQVFDDGREDESI